ncbi:MAG: efflux RND transporter periplasmic adaptor subunit, partial [Pseudomonadota bacterium]
FAGETSIHQFESGQFLSANSVVTMLVGSESEMWVDFSLPQKYAAIETGTTVKVLAADISQEVIPARVIAVDKTISRDSRTIAVRAVLEKELENIKPGTIVSVSVPIESSQQVVRLPGSAVRVDTFGAYVFRLESDDDAKLRAIRTPVDLAEKVGEYAIVSSGLTAGQHLATKGAFKLREGIWVKDANDAQPDNTETQ